MILPLGQPRAFEPGQEPRIWWVHHRNSSLAPERSHSHSVSSEGGDPPSSWGPLLVFTGVRLGKKRNELSLQTGF